MLTALNSAVSGLDAYQEQMDIIGNNIANINTTGFKSATGVLADSFSNTLQAATAATSTVNAIDAMQVGTGVTTAAITNNWSQGSLTSTGVASNLAINGNGFFIVQDPISGTQYVTQDGDFSVNAKGYLVNESGMYLIGTSPQGPAAPIQLTPTTGESMTSFTVSPQGVVTMNYADGTSSSAGTIVLQNFTNPQALTSVGNNLYSYSATVISLAGGLAATANPGSSGTGTIQSGSLELSNVDLSTEMADLIAAQRGFEANSKIVTTSDELLQTAVNMKR
jgi:flagellar hook protein FlgE